MIKNIVAVLEGLGYDVFTTKQESTRPNQIVVVLDNIELEVETTTSYYVYEYTKISWTTEDVYTIKDDVVKIASALYNGINETPFKLGKPVITQPGTMYLIEMICEYSQVIET